MANRQDLNRFAQAASQKYGVPLSLVEGVIQQESGWNPNARSPAGAQGLMQLMPGTAAGLGVKNPFDPQQNIDGGVKYLGMQLKRFNNDPKLALAAYNAGPGAVLKYKGVPPYQETQNYVSRILGSPGGGSPLAKPNLRTAIQAAKTLAPPKAGSTLTLAELVKASNDQALRLVPKPAAVTELPEYRSNVVYSPDEVAQLADAAKSYTKTIQQPTLAGIAQPKYFQPNATFGSDKPTIVLDATGKPVSFANPQEAANLYNQGSNTTRNTLLANTLGGAAAGTLFGPLGTLAGAAVGFGVGLKRRSDRLNAAGQRLYDDSQLLNSTVRNLNKEAAPLNAAAAQRFQAIEYAGGPVNYQAANAALNQQVMPIDKRREAVATLLAPGLPALQNVQALLNSDLESITQELNTLKQTAIKEGQPEAVKMARMKQLEKLQEDYQIRLTRLNDSSGVLGSTPTSVEQGRVANLRDATRQAAEQVTGQGTVATTGALGLGQIAAQNYATQSGLAGNLAGNETAQYGAELGLVGIRDTNANQLLGVRDTNDTQRAVTRDTNNTSFVRDQQMIQAGTAAREQEAEISQRAQKYTEQMVVQRQKIENQVQKLIAIKGVQKARNSPEYQRLQEEAARLDYLLGGSGAPTREQTGRGLTKPLSPLQALFNSVTAPFGGDVKTPDPLYLRQNSGLYPPPLGGPGYAGPNLPQGRGR